MNKIEQRLEQQKSTNRAMQSYVLTLYEMVLEIEPENILEIGVQFGQSTKTMLLGLSNNGHGKLFSIDHKSRDTILDEEHEDLKKYWEFFKSDSHDPKAMEEAKKALKEGEMYDMLFIDGDHKMPGVKQDFDEFGSLVKPGGLIVLHDITNNNEDVHELWETITWEKFGFNWGKSKTHIIPGFGLVKKPM